MICTATNLVCLDCSNRCAIKFGQYDNQNLQWKVCTSCNGTGKAFDNEKCHTCNGFKLVHNITGKPPVG